jgi:ribosomal protein S18 acetylase RimI-like enzyme
VIRKFEISDLESVLDIEQASFGREAWDRRLFLAYSRRCPELFLVATAGRRITGYIITCLRSSNAELASIAVLPRDRRRGVGEAMLRAVSADLRLRRVKTWWLMAGVENEGAIEFYQRFGFVKARRVKRYYAPGRDAWRMHLSLETRLKATTKARGTIPATTA